MLYTHSELQLSFLLNKYIFQTARVGYIGGGLLYFIEAGKRHSKQKQKLVIRGEIPAIWPAIRGDREMSAVYETSGRVLVLCAPKAHVKVKSDYFLNPLWTSLTACVIWNAPLPSIQNFSHASQSGRLLMETLFLSAMWQRNGEICCLYVSCMGGFPLWILPVQYQATRNHTGHWCGSRYWEGFDGLPTTMYVQYYLQLMAKNVQKVHVIITHEAKPLIPCGVQIIVSVHSSN